MNKSNMKILIILLVVFALFFLICYFFQGDRKLSKGLVIVNGYSTYEYRYRSWRKSSNLNIKWSKFKLYSNQDYVGEFFVNVTNRFYFFDKNIKSYDVSYPYIAFASDLNIKVLDYKVEDVNDTDLGIIREYLGSKKYNYDGKFNTLKKYVVNLNNDNKDDYIYIASNQLYTDNYIYTIFAYIDSKYIDISYMTSSDNYKSYELGWVLSVGNDNINDIILVDDSNERDTAYILRYAKNKYNFIKR